MEKYRNRDVAQDELIKLLEAEAKDYRALYRMYADNFLNVSADFGRFSDGAPGFLGTHGPIARILSYELQCNFRPVNVSKTPNVAAMYSGCVRHRSPDLLP